MRGVDPVTRGHILLFNPRLQTWEEHFRWARDRHTLIGRTPVGRVTIAALNVNSELRREARRVWFDIGLLP